MGEGGVDSATALGEHLLVGLIVEPDGVAGQVLRLTRRAAAVREQMQPLVQRIERLEERIGMAPETDTPMIKASFK